MRQQTFIFTLIVLGILINADRSAAQREKREFVWPTIRLRGALQELPAELKSVTPFKTDSWFSVKDSENREQLYLQTLILFDFFVGVDPPYDWFAERQGAMQFAASYDIKRKRKKAKQDIEKVEYFKDKSKRWSPRRDRYEIDDRYKPRMVKALKKVAWIYDALESAQQERSETFMHPDFISRFRPAHFGFHQVQNISEAIYAVDPIENLSYLRICKIHLTICRELLHFGSAGAGLDEKFALEKLLPVGLWGNQDEESIDQCIAFLQEHLEETEGVDTVVENAKLQFIRTVLALNDLRDKKYDRKAIAPWTEAGAIMYLLDRGFRNASLAAVSVADDLEERLAPKYAAFAQFSDEEKKGLEETIEKLRKVSQPNTGGFSESWLSRIANEMKREDFANEVKIQQTRFREIKAACKKTASERAKDLEALEVLWTIDPSWKKSPLLRYIGCNYINDNELYMRASRRAALCLAVVAKWRMAHDGNPPDSLQEAFDFAKIKDVPKDPYCDRPLEMSNSKVATTITSTELKSGKKLEFSVEF